MMQTVDHEEQFMFCVSKTKIKSRKFAKWPPIYSIFYNVSIEEQQVSLTIQIISHIFLAPISHIPFVYLFIFYAFQIFETYNSSPKNVIVCHSYIKWTKMYPSIIDVYSTYQGSSSACRPLGTVMFSKLTFYFIRHPTALLLRVFFMGYKMWQYFLSYVPSCSS